MCPHGRAHWRHLANTIELVVPLANPSPQPKRQIDQLSRFCTANGRKSPYFTMGDPFPQRCPISRGDLDPHLIHDSLSQTEPTVQTASQSVQFAQVTTECPCYTLQWAPLSPKLPLSTGDLDPHLIHGSLGSPKSSTQIASRSVQPF